MERSELISINLLSIGRSAMISSYLLFLPLFLRDSGIDAIGLGILFAIFSITALLVSFPFGALNDTLGSKKVIQLSIVFLLVALLIAYLSKDFLGFAFSLVLLSIGNTTLFLSIENALLKKSSDVTLSGNMGVYTFLRSIAFGVGCLIGGFLIQTISFAAAIVFFFLLTLSFFPITNYIRHTSTVEFDLGAYLREFAKPVALPIVVIMFLFAVHWGTENVALAVFLKNFSGLTAIEIGIVSFVSALTMAVAAWLAGATPALGRKLLIVGLFLSGLGMVLHPLGQGLLFASVVRSLHTIGDGLVVVTVIVLMGMVFAKDRIGGANGAVNLINRASEFLSSILVGFLLATNLALPFYFAGAASVLAGLLALAVFHPTLKSGFRN